MTLETSNQVKGRRIMLQCQKPECGHRMSIDNDKPIPTQMVCMACFTGDLSIASIMRPIESKLCLFDTFGLIQMELPKELDPRAYANSMHFKQTLVNHIMEGNVAFMFDKNVEK